MGYPGEIERRGLMYEGTGTVEEIESTYTKGSFYHHDVDTTKGQSGSVVLADGLPVAVHVGYNDEWMMNVATAITPAVNEWIKSIGKIWRFPQFFKD